MKNFFLLFFSFFLCIGFTGCNSGHSARINVVTSFYPVYIMVLNLTNGISDVSVTNMTQSHVGCLHDFHLESDDMKSLEKASGFIINGAGMESFIDNIKGTYPDLEIVDSSSDIDLLSNEYTYKNGENIDGHDSHHHDMVYNPHIWVSVSNYIKQVENIRDGLIKLDPSNSAKYNENAIEYIKKLQFLKNEMHSELDNLPNRNIITFHEAFPYFAKEFDLNIAAVINVEPNNEPSAKELKNTIQIINKLGIKSLFIEPQYSDNSAKIISDETGANIYTLNSASSGEVSKDAYINVMKENLNVLKEALS